jgi:hypothetical protein
MEQYFRTSHKWAKISGKRGKWCVAFGYTGEARATRLQYWPTKAGAHIAARYWVDDF